MQKPWEAGKLGMPHNPTTEKGYRGGNAIHLLSVAAMKGYDDPRWLTYKQAEANGWQVRKGERGTQIEYWEFPDMPKGAKPGGNEDQKTERRAETEDGRRIVHRTYTVFNAQQIEGIPAYDPKQKREF